MATKKTPAKAAASNGAAELKAFREAIQNLKQTGSALAKAARANKQFRAKSALRSAIDSAQNAAARIAKSVPLDPPTTTVSQ